METRKHTLTEQLSLWEWEHDEPHFRTEPNEWDCYCQCWCPACADDWGDGYKSCICPDCPAEL